MAQHDPPAGVAPAVWNALPAAQRVSVLDPAAPPDGIAGEQWAGLTPGERASVLSPAAPLAGVTPARWAGLTLPQRVQRWDKRNLEARDKYARVEQRGDDRLTVSTILGSITFAAFAALLATGTVVTLTVPATNCKPRYPCVLALYGFDLEKVNLSVIEIILGAASLLFLLAIAQGYLALHTIRGPTVQQAIQSPHHLSVAVQDALFKAHRQHQRAGRFTRVGVYYTALSLILIGVHFSPYVGCGIVLLSAITVVWRQWIYPRWFDPDKA